MIISTINLTYACIDISGAVPTGRGAAELHAEVPPLHSALAPLPRLLPGTGIIRLCTCCQTELSTSIFAWINFNHPLYQINREQEHAVTAHYRRVWMIDVRDSYFQSDPFAFISLPAVPSVAPNAARASSTSLHVFSGVESFPIRECGWNSGWIKDCFGPQVLGAVGHRGIICSGVSAGSVEAVAEYVRTMSEIITGSAHSKVAGEFPQCERNGVDQGVHNVLVHTGALDHLNLRSWGQADSPVANMQAKVAVLHCNGDGADERCVVRNRAGVAVAVVHQYDRYPQLQQFLFKKVCPPCSCYL